MTDFILLTGFLGSGKTTLIADFLRRPEAADTAVIVNEIGEIGLDGAILAEGVDVPIAMLSNGCLCCSIAGDLEQTIAALIAARADGPPLARIIVETSGVSKPGPILRSLAGLAPLRPRIAVVATVDSRAAATAAEFDEALTQWACAQTLVLTKTDLASPAERRRAREIASGVNPIADIVDLDDRAAAVTAALAFHSAAASAPSFPPLVSAIMPASGLRHPRVQVLLARPDPAILWDEMAEWLDNLAGRCGDRLLRIKGVVRTADRPDPVLVQSVGTLFSAPRPFRQPADRESFLVLILRDTDTDELSSITPASVLTLTRLGR